MSAVAHEAPGRRWSATRWLRTWLPAFAVFGLVLVAWQWLLPALGVERYLLPPLSDVLDALRENWGTLRHGAWITFKEALAGFAIGSSLAFVSALVLARWRPLGNALMPYMIAANAVPIIAFAPITNAWFGITNSWSKIVMASVLCFFPVLVNTLRGLTSVRPESLELMRSYAAGQTAIFRRVRIPASLPFVFTALKIATVLAMIGAVVADFFGGDTEPLGVQIPQAVSAAQYELAWAAIMVASLLGIAFYGAVALVERLVLRWDPAARSRPE